MFVKIGSAIVNSDNIAFAEVSRGGVHITFIGGNQKWFDGVVPDQISETIIPVVGAGYHLVYLDLCGEEANVLEEPILAFSVNTILSGAPHRPVVVSGWFNDGAYEHAGFPMWGIKMPDGTVEGAGGDFFGSVESFRDTCLAVKKRYVA